MRIGVEEARQMPNQKRIIKYNLQHRDGVVVEYNSTSDDAFLNNLKWDQDFLAASGM